MFALTIFCLFMSHHDKPKKSKAIHHYFSTQAPAGHVPDESEIAYCKLPEHY